MIGKKLLQLTLLILTLVICTQAYCEVGKDNLYTTGVTMELDRCASAWLIKRYVDHGAVFKLFPEDTLITEGVVFDRPEGQLQRTHNRSTFEVIRSKYEIVLPQLEYLGSLINDVEVNYWGKRNTRKSKELEIELKKRLASSSTCEEALTQCIQFFDKLIEDPTFGGQK